MVEIKTADKLEDEVEKEIQTNMASNLAVVEALTKGETDQQVATAKAYPRSVTVFKKRATDLATIDEETAASCFYVLPRAGKNIEGPSARFAEIIAYSWTNLRVDGRPVGEDNWFITSRGTAWDMETNVAFGFEVKRRIVDKYGRKFTPDMIGVTANAATSIALRNAVLKVIPKAFWSGVYERCRELVKGDLDTLADRRAKALEYFQKLGVSNERLFGTLGVKGEDDITGEQLVTLRGLSTALKEGDTTIDEAFPLPVDEKKPALERLTERLKSEQAQPRPTPTEEKTVAEQKEHPLDRLDRAIELAQTEEQLAEILTELDALPKKSKFSKDEKMRWERLVYRLNDKNKELQAEKTDTD